uniref:Kinesin light chain n=2 Tax=Craspedostauros australis TaxID=1486917 RepID=A0A7R9ZNC9_9STRA|mmetsp:Transcript_19551/g.54324  ORF Transcript_19551/g.54324 Transcript_19551/m.54324 type:complete len:151 (+) Transcript_19551:41-493(+)
MGHDHPRVIATLDNLGYSYSKGKNYQQALSCYREMLTAQISNNNNTFTQECCVTLQKQNYMHIKLRDIDGAIDHTKRALAMLYATANQEQQQQHGSSAFSSASSTTTASTTSSNSNSNPVLETTEQILSDLLLKRIKKQRSKKGCGKGCF